MLQNRLFNKLFVTYMVLILLALGVLSGVAVIFFRQSYVAEVSGHLGRSAALARFYLGQAPAAPAMLNIRVQEVGTALKLRITVIEGDGSVTADSEANPTLMENHRLRPEVIMARNTGLGYESRYSKTRSMQMLYLAVLWEVAQPAGRILRLAVPLSELDHIYHRMYAGVGITFLLLTLVAAIMGFRLVGTLTRRIKGLVDASQAIAQGDFSGEVNDKGQDELGLLANAVTAMREELRARFAEIEERKNLLNTVLSGIREGVIAVDGQEVILFTNYAVARFLEFDHLTASGKYLWEIVRHDQFLQFAKAAIKGRAAILAQEVITGASRHFRVYCVPMTAGSLPSRCFIFVVNDVTEAMKYDQLRKDFVANASHELRTPLTFIHGYLETLKELSPAERDKAQEFIDIIGKHTRQLLNLVADLLDLSSIESHQGVAKIRPTNLRHIVEKSVENFRPALAAKHHMLEQHVLENVPPVKADPDLLEKALGNLLDNAIKYTPDHGCIRIEARHTGVAIEITVQDNGIGIPEADWDRIFERFYRVDKSRSRDMGGTGLGLAIVKHIVQLHHGTISVKSKLQAGSSFTISLPG
jgi:two-component system phosphate regulon sensor histidine kinase PhoR